MLICLGFDGLGIDLVEKFKLKEVMQKAYTATDLSDFKTDPFTPIIWASMLTGRKPEDMERIYIKMRKRHKPPFSNILRRVLPLRLRALLGKVWDAFTRDPRGPAMMVLGDFLKRNNISTIFEELEERGVSYWHNSIPGYDGVPHHEERMRLIQEGAWDEYYSLVWEQHRKALKEFFAALKKQYDFYFFYTNLIDAIGHLFYTKFVERMKLALEVQRIVKEIHEKFGDAVIYVVSDHGMQIVGDIADHSNQGFFSSNTGELIRKPQDLYYLLKKNLLLKNEARYRLWFEKA